MNKQTAVEWLMEKLNQCEPMFSGIQSNEHKDYIENLVNQAKELEKKQIIDAYNSGMKFILVNPNYYDETFKNKTK